MQSQKLSHSKFCL